MNRYAAALLAALALATTAAPAAADPQQVLRIGSVAPDGSGWANALSAFARYVESESKGALKVKLYLNAVAGDEVEMGERTRKGQLDGVASGQLLCAIVAPSMRVLRLPGVFQSRDEARDVLTRLEPTVEAEAAQAGFVILGSAGIGADIFFTREPVHSMAELQKVKLWRWAADDAAIAMSKEMGLTVVPTPLFDARRAYEDGKLDGFMAAPSAAVAFQWSSAARYVTDLHSAYLYGCLAMSERSYQKLPSPAQKALRAGAAQLLLSIEELGRKQDAQLLGGLFQKQGLRSLPVSPAFRAEYFAAAKAARDRIGDKLVPRALLERVLRMLADYRLEHP
ncbi:MAG TPA: TRAP transporter substrate-binding protein DctP [Polyangia bacterium]|nr:TRAP transporter substrate-binding protein DctP [Polyangia bacterium]